LLASAAADGNVIVWDTVTGKEMFRRKAKTKSPHSMAISAEASLVAVGDDDGTMHLCDIGSGNIENPRLGSDQR
jgi:WD40 repeat protein